MENSDALFVARVAGPLACFYAQDWPLFSFGPLPPLWSLLGYMLEGTLLRLLLED